MFDTTASEEASLSFFEGDDLDFTSYFTDGTSVCGFVTIDHRDLYCSVLVVPADGDGDDVGLLSSCVEELGSLTEVARRYDGALLYEGHLAPRTSFRDQLGVLVPDLCRRVRDGRA